MLWPVQGWGEVYLWVFSQSLWDYWSVFVKTCTVLLGPGGRRFESFVIEFLSCIV